MLPHMLLRGAVGLAIAGVCGFAVPATASAAPPANDNRDAAEVLPAFPATTHGTTTEATLERLDPQVSDCGRIDGTVWYRIESAPDGRVVLTLQAAARFAPVVRVYRREPSAIREIDCGTSPAGGRVVTSFQTVRGAGYLVLVGRRPDAADGEFDLRAELFLPPANDRRNDAQPLGALPASIRGSTLGATGDAADGTACGLSGGSVWYALSGRPDGRVVLRLTAAGELDAAVTVYERVRSQFERVGCAPTDREGRAQLAFETRRRATYLIVVGHRGESDPGEFTLDALAAERPEALPGRALPSRGTTSTVHGLTDVNDLWSVRLREGTTYRIALGSSACVTAELRGPGARLRSGPPVRRLRCRDYTAFTPGPGAGGRYVLEVEAAPSTTSQRYVLRVSRAGLDDIGIGIRLSSGRAAAGRLDPSGVDVVDLYHFDVVRPSDLRMTLRQQAGTSFSLALLRDTGGLLGAGEEQLARRLGPGRYVVAVRGQVGTRGGRYRIALLLRDVTTTSVLVNGRTSAAALRGTTVSLTALVSPASGGGLVVLRIERFDPLTGWHFHRSFQIAGSGSVSWAPPAAGRWRVSARFRGTGAASPSESGYAYLVVS